MKLGRLAGSLVQPSSMILAPALAGLLVALSFPPFGYWFLAWVALAPLGFAIQLSNRVFEPMLGAFLGCMVLHLVGIDWIRTSFHGSGASGPWAAAWLTTSVLVSPSWIVWVAVTHLAIYRFALPMAIALPTGWIAGDLTRTWLANVLAETGFPWLQLAATQTAWLSFVQVGDLIGPAGIGGLIACANGALLDVLVRRDRRSAASVMSVAGILLAVLAYGQWSLNQASSIAGPNVLLVPATLLPTALASDPVSTTNVDLCLWPESVLSDDASSDNEMARGLESAVKRSGKLSLIGWHRKRPGFVAESLAVVDPAEGLVDIYDKSYLVPWVEFNPWISLPYSLYNSSPVRAGTNRNTFLCAGARVAPAICYDVCFPEFLRGFDSPTFFAVASSESFDATGRLPDQMTQILQLRAVEFRRSVVRNVKDGHSGVIDSCGRVLSDIADLKEPTIVGPVPIDQRFSLYARLGDYVLLLPAIILGIACLGRRRRRRDA